MIRLISLFACLLGLLLTGCGGGTDIRLENNQSGSSADTSTPLVTGEPHLIHVDTIERVVTIRNGEDVDGFLIANDRSGKQTGVLKALPMRSKSSLRTADILEGKPRINDRVRKATATEASELAKIYRDAGE